MGVSDPHEEQSLTGGPYKPTILPIEDPKKKPVSSGHAKSRQYATAIIVNVAALAAGTVMGWSSPSGPLLQSDSPPMGEDPLSDEHLSWLASINMLGGAAGTLLYGVLADRWGRRMTGLAVAVPFALSWILIATTDILEVLYFARCLAGIACGGTMVVCPLYVGETAEDAYRGPLGTFLAVGINSGIVLAFIIGAVVGYRTLPLVCLLLPCIYFLGLLKLPETPVYHVKRGRLGCALRSLQWYRGGPGPAVDAELEAMHASAKKDVSSLSLKDLFCHRGTRKALITSLGLMLNQQFCGVLAILSYTQIIFEDAGSTLSPVAATVIVGTLQAVTTYLSSFLVDRMGRKTLLIVSNTLMGTCISTLGGCFWAKNNGYDLSVIGWLPVVCMSIYVIAFALGLGPVPLVMLGETYSTKVRSMATSLSIVCQQTSAFLACKFFANISEALGIHGSMWLFGGCCLLGIIFVVFYVIETKGKTLDQILMEYNGDSLLPTDSLDRTGPFTEKRDDQ